MGFSSKQKFLDAFHLTTEGLEAWSPHVCDFVISFAEHVGCESALIEADSTLAAHDWEQERPGERNEGEWLQTVGLVCAGFATLPSAWLGAPCALCVQRVRCRRRT